MNRHGSFGRRRVATSPAPIARTFRPSRLRAGGSDVGVWVVGRVGETTFGKASTQARVATASVVAVGQFPTESARVVVSGKVHDGAASADTDGALLSAMGIQPDDDRVASPPQTPLHVARR